MEDEYKPAIPAKLYRPDMDHMVIKINEIVEAFNKLSIQVTDLKKRVDILHKPDRGHS